MTFYFILPPRQARGNPFNTVQGKQKIALLATGYDSAELPALPSDFPF